MSANDKTYFAPLPLRAIGDSRLSALDLRVLACLCAHDRMSKVTGKGQGSWASNETLSREVGCHYSRLSSSVTRLGKFGYIEREQHPLNKRLRVYRVIYNPGWDTLPSGKQSTSAPLTSDSRTSNGAALTPLPTSGRQTLCQSADDDPEQFADVPGFPDQNQSDYSANIFRRSDEGYFAEATKGNSAEAASRCPPAQEPCDNVGGQLARLERAMKSGEKIDRLACYDWLVTIDGDGITNWQWALRLSEQLVDLMDDEEYFRWRAVHPQ